MLTFEYAKCLIQCFYDLLTLVDNIHLTGKEKETRDGNTHSKDSFLLDETLLIQ
jgi:hypothetical protein